MIDAVSEKKFLLLKKRLDALHYCQPFSVDSAPLVENLLNDLIKTNEGFENIRKINEELKTSVQKAEHRLEPLRRENKTLLKDNNELHSEIMRVKEDAEYKEGRWNNTFKSLQDDKTDLKHLIQCKDAARSKLEEENASLRRKLELLIKKQYLGAGKGLENVPPEFRSLITGKSGKFEVTRTLKAHEEGEQTEGQRRTVHIEDQNNLTEQLRKAEDKINSLKEELKNEIQGKVTFDEEIRHLQIQVNNRDKEIKRLQSRLDVGEGNFEKISTEYNLKTNSEKIEKLNSQIDFLSKENFGLEETVKNLKKELSRTDAVRIENMSLKNTIHELTQKNEDLGSTVKNKERVIGNMRDTRNNLESEQLEKKERQLLGLENEVLSLTKRLESAMMENSKYKMDSSHANQTIAAYNSDKLAFSELITDLKQSKSELENRFNQVELELEKKNLENQNWIENYNVSQGKVQNLQREIELLQINQSKSAEEQSYHSQITDNLRKRINELESENLTLLGEKKDLEGQAERANRLKDHAEEQLDRFRNEAYQTRANVDTTNTAKQRFQTLYEESQKDIEFLKKERRDMESKYLDEKKNSTELDIKCHEYFNNLKGAQDKIKSLELELDMVNEQLALRLQDIRRSEGEKMEVERELSMLKTNQYRLEEQNEKNKRLKEEIKGLEDDRAKTLKQIDNLRFEVRDLNEKIVRQEENLKKERFINNELNHKLESLALESEGIEMNLKRAREREQEYANIGVEFDLQKRKERDLLDEMEKLRRDIVRQEGLIANGTRQVDNLKQQKEELLRENKKLTEEISFLKTDESDIRTKSIKLQERINNFEISIADARDDKLRDERKISELEEEARRAKIDLEREKRTNNELNEQIQQLKTLAESLESTRKELMNKLQNKNHERQAEEGDKMRLNEEIQLLKERIMSIEKEKEDLESTVIDIDKQRDGMQEQLDEKVEAYEILKRKYDELNDEYIRLRERRNEFTASNEFQVSRLQDLEGQLGDLNRRNKQLAGENAELKKANNSKELEIENLRKDVTLATRENRNLNQRVISLVEEQDKVKNNLTSVNHQERMMKQSLRATEMERDDLVNNYKAVCLENERLKRNVEALSAENQEYFAKRKDVERDLSYLRAQVQQLEQKENQYLNELSSYDRKINGLTRELTQAEFRIKEGHDAQERLARSFNQSREIAEGIEFSKEELQQRLSRNEHEKNMLTDQIRGLKREKEHLRQQLEDEKRRVQFLEETLDEEKERQRRQGINIQNLEGEKFELQRTLEACEKRIHTLQNNLTREADLETFQSRGSDSNTEFGTLRSATMLENKLKEKEIEVRNLINEQRSLRDENSQLKLSLYKAETQRDEIEKKLKLQASFDSTLSYDKLFSEGPSSKDRSERDWERQNYKTGPFKRNFEEASLSSQYLKEKGRTLGYYHEK